MWCNYRNWGGVLSIYLDVLITTLLFNRKDLFIFYRVIDPFTVIVVEEVFQRSVKGFDLVLNGCGVSTWSYQLGNLLAHSAFFLVVYSLFYFLLRFAMDCFLGF